VVRRLSGSDQGDRAHLWKIGDDNLHGYELTATNLTMVAVPHLAVKIRGS
jgi:hypothetical protein